jgi:hypothetical protein
MTLCDVRGGKPFDNELREFLHVKGVPWSRTSAEPGKINGVDGMKRRQTFRQRKHVKTRNDESVYENEGVLAIESALQL